MKRIGIRDVARQAGVSISTVSNALNRPQVVTPALAARVRRAAEELGYVPLQAAQQLRAGRSGLLGMTVIDITNPFFGAMVAGAEEAATEAGLRILVGNSDSDLEKEHGHLELFERVQVEGVIASPYGASVDDLDRLRRRGIPTVLVDAVDERGQVASVSFDDLAGGRLAVEHLIGLGRRRLAFIGGSDTVPQVSHRLAGARDAAVAHPDVRLEVAWTHRVTSEVGRELGLRIASMPAHERPDGIVTTNDHLACGIVYGLVAGGARVPEEVAIVGYDDIEFAAVAAVPLTSVRQPAREMGRRAAELLLPALGRRAPVDPADSMVFAPELIVRESTGGRS